MPSLYISDFLSELQSSEAKREHWQLWETGQLLNTRWLIHALIEIALNEKWPNKKDYLFQNNNQNSHTVKNTLAR